MENDPQDVLDNQLEDLDQEESLSVLPLKKNKQPLSDLVLENKKRLLCTQYPNIDPLMAELILKCPQHLIDKFMSDPDYWLRAPEVETPDIVVPDAFKTFVSEEDQTVVLD
jgi:hypothetical protein